MIRSLSPEPMKCVRCAHITNECSRNAHSALCATSSAFTQILRGFLFDNTCQVARIAAPAWTGKPVIWFWAAIARVLYWSAGVVSCLHASCSAFTRVHKHSAACFFCINILSAFSSAGCNWKSSTSKYFVLRLSAAAWPSSRPGSRAARKARLTNGNANVFRSLCITRLAVCSRTFLWWASEEVATLDVISDAGCDEPALIFWGRSTSRLFDDLWKLLGLSIDRKFKVFWILKESDFESSGGLVEGFWG